MTPNNMKRAMEFISKHNFEAELDDLTLRAMMQLEKLGPYLVQGEQDLNNLSLGWMDSVFRPDNQKRKENALAKNRSIQEKLAKLKAQIRLDFKKIKDANNLKEVQDAVQKMMKNDISIKNFSFTTQALLTTAFALVITGLIIVGVIASSFVPGGIFLALTSIGTMAAAYLIVEGIAVGQRYKALEQINQKYDQLDKEMDQLNNLIADT